MVQTLTGKTIELELNANYTVEDVKILIQREEGWAPGVQRLLCSGCQMFDAKTLQDYEIKDRSLIQMVLGVQGGGCMAYEIENSKFAPEWNFDFTGVVDEYPFFRGGSLYIRPLGSKRYAIKVFGEYESDDWLGGNINEA